MKSKQRKPRRKLADWHFPVVYYIQDNATKLIKIGTTTNARKRFASLRRQCPAGFTVLGFEKGGTRQERWIHDQFRRFRHHNEWFVAAVELQDRIEKFGFKRLQALLDRMTRADYQEVIDHLKAKAQRLHNLIGEYEYRQKNAFRRGDDPYRTDDDPDEPRGIRVHTIKEAMAWRAEWKDRLYRAVEAKTNEAWDDFMLWYGAGIFTSIVGRLECAEIMSLTLFLDEFESRWMGRHYAWCRRAKLAPRAAELLLLPLWAAFDNCKDIIQKLLDDNGGSFTHDRMMMYLQGDYPRPSDLFALTLERCRMGEDGEHIFMVD